MMNHKGTVKIETDRLVLRQAVLSDAEAVFRNWESDKLMTKYLRWSPYSNIEDSQKSLSRWIESYSDSAFYQWLIILKEIKESIGTISVVSMDEKLDLVHIGYCIGSKWWHHGYTSEALAAIIPFFFEQVGVNRIESCHDPNNPNSGLVMKKCGMKYEGTLRQADWSNQGIVDACVYGLLKEDYLSR